MREFGKGGDYYPIEEIHKLGVRIFDIELLSDIKPPKDIIKIGKGKVSNQITQKNSWIIVDELYNNKDIKAGDFIKIEYKEGFFSKATKSLMKL